MESRLSPVSKIQACKMYRKFHYEHYRSHVYAFPWGARVRSIQNNLQIFARGKFATHLEAAAESMSHTTVRLQLRKIM